MPLFCNKKGENMRRHHKVMVGSFSTVIIVLLIVFGVTLYSIKLKQEAYQNQLTDKISDLESRIIEMESNTNSKINDLSSSLIKTQNNLESLQTEVVDIDEEFGELKATTSADFSGIVQNAIKSVVSVRTDVGQGTGFLVSPEGYVVTNIHILQDGSEIYVLNYEREKIDAGLMGYNEKFDLALLKLEDKKSNYSYLDLGDSDEVEAGQKVVAIGNPLGLEFSVSEGIVSAVHRQGVNNVSAYLQTDAALNPGNSGGPLIDTQGEVIGINNFKVKESENLGFALESNYIRSVINSISQENFNQTIIE